MDQFKIRPPVEIPYFDHGGSLFKTVISSARRRDKSPVLFMLKKLVNICLYRISYFCPLNSIRIACHRGRGVNVGKNVYIGMQCTIDNAYPEYIYIEDNVSLAGECLIITHSNPYGHFHNITPARVSPVIIKNGAWICVRSVILPGVTVGVNSIVSACSVVNEDVPDYSVAAGNPAKIIAVNLPVV